MSRTRTHRGFVIFGLASCLLLVRGVAWADSGRDHRVEQTRPIKLGTSGGNINDSNASYCCGGTLGSLVKNVRGQQFILTNNHVGALVNQGVAGQGLIQPGLIDQSPVCYQDKNDVVANLSAFVPIKFGGTSNLVDAAVAQVVAGKVDSTGAILDIGTISATPRGPTVGLKVKKSGRTSGLTTGKIYAINATVTVQYQQGCGIGAIMTARFDDQIIITPGSFLKGGDSGSLVVENVGANPKPVALAFAGSSNFAVGNRIQNVLNALGVSFVGTNALKAPSGLPTLSILDARLEAASRTRARYGDFLSGLPEAVGSGVGVSDTNPNEAVIQLYVRQASDSVRLAAPAALEGVRVEVVETGEFRALPGSCTPCGSAAKTSCR